MYGQLLLFCAGFIVVFSPWLVTGVDEAGVPWLWVKFKFVIGQRFQSMELSSPRAAMPVPADPASSLPWIPPVASLTHHWAAPSWSALNTGLQDGVQVIPSEPSQAAPVMPFVPRTLSHALHNMAAALLSLPDMFVLDNLHQLSQKDPWGDHTWQGNLTPAQHVAAVVNLVLLAIGLAWSWQRFRLAGLVPAIVFLGYDLSLAVAATSGGRYVVPINWVAYFYYVLGWIAIIEALARSRVAAALDSSAPTAPADGTSDRKFLSAGHCRGRFCCDAHPLCQCRHAGACPNARRRARPIGTCSGLTSCRSRSGIGLRQGALPVLPSTHQVHFFPLAYRHRLCERLDGREGRMSFPAAPCEVDRSASWVVSRTTQVGA